MFLVHTETGLVLQEPSGWSCVLNSIKLLRNERFIGIKRRKLNRVGNMARLGDMWHEIQGIKKTNNGESYKLFAKDEWVNESDVEEFRTKEDLNY